MQCGKVGGAGQEGDPDCVWKDAKDSKQEKRTIAFQVVPVVKKKEAHLPVQEMHETQVGYLGWDDPLE